MKRIQGFTLLELMIALCVFAILTTLAITGLNSILNNRDQIDARLVQLGELQMTSVLLQRDFSQMIDRPMLDATGNKQPALEASGTDITFIRTGYTNPMNAMHRSSLQKVEYSLSGKDLTRTTWPVLDAAPKTKSSARKILSQVTTLKLLYIDHKGLKHDSWPPAAVENAPKWPPFPSGILVSMTLARWGDVQFLIPVYAGDLEKLESQEQGTSNAATP